MLAQGKTITPTNTNITVHTPSAIFRKKFVPFIYIRLTLRQFILKFVNKKLFNFLALSVLIFGLVIRLIPLRHNNFYFTMDQGNDAIKVSGITTYHHFPVLGPETSIFGLFAGPAWYYFISIGYFLSAGHPIGPVILLIVLNTFLTLIIIKKISKEVSPKIGLIVGLALQFSWLYYDSSRYSFNPFPNTFLSFVALFWLCDFLSGKQDKFVLAAIPIGLFIHTDVAPSIPMIAFYVLLGFYSLYTKRLKPQYLFYGLGLIFLLLIPHLISELTSNFSQIHTIIKEFNNPRGPLTHSQLPLLSYQIFIITARSIFRQIPEIGFLGFIVVVLIFLGRLKSPFVHNFTKHFVLISLCILFMSWIFFSSNSGWRDWQTSFISPLIFTSVLLVLLDSPTNFTLILLATSFLSHLHAFLGLYFQYLKPSNDPSLLTNELKAIDYVYTNSGDQKFSTYIWIPSIFDHHYQYLFRWYAVKKYGSMPCEVNTYPKSPQTYLPNWYAPKLRPDPNCLPTLRYLIIEKDKNNSIDQTWYSDITTNTTLIEKTNVGKIFIEKRQLNKK